MSRSWLSVGRALVCEAVAAAVFASLRQLSDSTAELSFLGGRASRIDELSKKSLIRKISKVFICRYLSINVLRLPLQRDRRPRTAPRQSTGFCMARSGSGTVRLDDRGLLMKVHAL
jgi:hypothetical protein